MRKSFAKLAANAALVTFVVAATNAPAQELKIGMTATFTGPNSTVGLSHRQVSEIFPSMLGGMPVRWIVIDDATDPVTAVKNARKFVEEERVDAIFGSSSVITTAPMFEISTKTGTPQLALSPTPLPKENREWLFNVAQPLDIMVAGVVENMKRKNLTKIAYIGFADGWGDQNLQALTSLAQANGIEIVARERYARTDSSVTAQVLNIVASGAQAVYVGGAGTASALPHIALVDQGFSGPIYHSHGAVSQSFIDAGGAAVEGAVMPTSPMVVSADLPPENLSKAPATDFIGKFKARWGDTTVSPFAGYSWDAMLLLHSAVTKAKAIGKPGTPEFRKALRDALQDGTETVGVSAVYRYSPEDHNGVDNRGRVLVVIKGGRFRLLQ